MRKITSFLALFLLFAGTAVAQISSLSELVYNTKAYSVETVAGKNYRASGSGYDRSGWYSTFGSSSLISYRTAGVAYNPSEASQQFVFEKDASDNVYIYAVGVGMYLTKNNTYSATPQDAVTIVANTAYAGAFTFYFDSTHYINSNGSGNISIDNWNTHDDGNGVYITEQRDASEAMAEALANAKSSVNTKIASFSTQLPGIFTASDVAAAQAVADGMTDLTSLSTATVANKYVRMENKNNAGVYLCAGPTAAQRTSDYMNSILNFSFNADGTFYIEGFVSGSYLGDVSTSVAVTTTTTPQYKYVSYVPATGYISVRPSQYGQNTYRYIHFGGSGVVGWEASDASQFVISEASITDVKAAINTAIENFPTMIPNVYTATDVVTAKAAVDAVSDLGSLRTTDLGIDKYVTMENRSQTGYYLNVGSAAASRSSDAMSSVIRLVANFDGTFYIQGYVSGSYLGDVQVSTAVTTTTTPDVKFVAYVPATGYASVRPAVYANTGWSDGYHFIHFDGSGNVVGWETTANASQFTIEEVPVPVTISYVVKQNDVEIWRTTGAANSGDVITAFPSDLLRDYTTLSYPNAPYTVTGADGQEFVANIESFTPPFTLSTDYSTATWYIWHQHTNNAGSTVYTNGDNIVWSTTGYTYEKPRQFAFMGDPYNGIKIINKVQGAGKYLSNTDPATMTTTPYGWQLREQTNTTYINGHTGAFGLFNTDNSKYLNGQAGTLKYWAGFDQGSTIWVEEVPAGDFYMTYVIKDTNDATLFTSDPIETYYHASVTGLPSDAYYNMSAFYDYSNPNVTIENNNTNVEVTATPKANPLIQYTEDMTSPVYYNLNIRSKYLVYNSTATGEVTLQTESEPFHSDASWAFVGTPYGGFQLYNKTKGTGYVLTYSSVVTGGNQGNNNVVFVPVADATGKFWYLNTNSSGFVLRMKENPDIYFHHDSGNNFLRTCSLSEWSYVHTDAGSTIVAATDEAVLFALYDYMKDITYGDGPNEYTATGISASDAQAAITQTGEDINNAVTSAYADDYNGLLTLSAVSTLNMPTSGFYRIKGKTSDTYLAAGLASNNKFNMTSATDATTIFYFDGSKLVNFSDGMVNGMSTSSWAWVTGIENGSAVTFQDGNTAGGYGIVSSNAYFYDNGDGSTPSADRGGSASMTDDNTRYRSWFLEEVFALPVTISSVGYATFYTPIAVTIPAGVEAYQAAVSGENIRLTSIDDGVIPVNFGVVLKATAGEYSFPLTETTWTASDYHSNQLLGTVAAIDVADNEIYTLRQATEGGVGFFLKSAGTLKGFRSYLASGSGGARGFIFDETTGIQQVEVEGLEGTAYDLQGRRVQKPANGLYIVNGKKIIVK